MQTGLKKSYQRLQDWPEIFMLVGKMPSWVHDFIRRVHWADKTLKVIQEYYIFMPDVHATWEPGAVCCRFELMSFLLWVRFYFMGKTAAGLAPKWYMTHSTKACNLHWWKQSFVLGWEGKSVSCKADIFWLKPAFGADTQYFWILTLREHKSKVNGLKSSKNIWNYCLLSHFHWNLVLKWIRCISPFLSAINHTFKLYYASRHHMLSFYCSILNHIHICVEGYFCILQVDWLQIEQIWNGCLFISFCMEEKMSVWESLPISVCSILGNIDMLDTVRHMEHLVKALCSWSPLQPSAEIADRFFFS